MAFLVKKPYVKWSLYLATALCACTTLYLDSHLTFRVSKRNTRLNKQNQFSAQSNYSLFNKDILTFKNPLNNKTFQVRLSLTSTEQWRIVSQNLSLPHQDLSIPTRKRWSTKDKKDTNWRNLDLLGMRNFTYNKKYKNPCWRDIHQTMNCLPYFFLIGAPKSGTTDLYKRLIQHPDIVPPVMKEPHWLTRGRLGPYRPDGLGLGLKKEPPALTAYMKYFVRTSLLMYNVTNADKVTGDCSASTLWDNDIWTQLPRNNNPLEPVYTNADYVHKLNRNARIIVLLRDPVQRLYSDYLYFEADNAGQSPAYFHSHVVQSVRMFTACMTVFSVRACVYHEKLNKLLKIRLRISLYYIYLIEWYQRFPSDQILVLSLDEYARNTRNCLRKVFSFLKIRPLRDQALDNIVNKDRFNARSAADKTIGNMWPETKQLLNTFFQPFNLKLYDLINRRRI